MSDEGISAVKMGVTFVMFAAVMVFVVFNIIWGWDINRQTNADMDSSEQQAETKYFKQALDGEGCDLPVSGAYSLIENNRDNVSAITIGTAEHVTGNNKGNLYGYVMGSSGFYEWKQIYDSTENTVRDAQRNYENFTIKSAQIAGEAVDFNGLHNDEAEIWLRNNMHGRCNVKAFRSGDNTYLLTIELYND